MNTNEIVIAAINTSNEIVKEYWAKTRTQRLSTGMGSTFDGIDTIEEMEEALLNSNWVEAYHENIMEGCKAYVTTDIPGGRYGLIDIKTLPDDTILTVCDPKNTGKVSICVNHCKGPEAKETWLIVGPEQGKDVVYTFHPGEPVRPSFTETTELPDGTKLTKEEALRWGFNKAKVC